MLEPRKPFGENDLHPLALLRPDLDVTLVEPLLAGEDAAGVLGRLAGGALKRLPSSVYWAGLGTWGIRRFERSQEEYHRELDRIYTRRDEREHRRRKDGEELPPDPSLDTWHPRVPAPPPDFPEGVTFALTQEEAEFLRDRITTILETMSMADLTAPGARDSLKARIGVMVGTYYEIAHYQMGFMLGLKAFTAAVLGGIGNLAGAMLGGILLGLIEALGAGYIGDLTGGFLGSHYQDIFAFVVLIGVLMFKPSGLFGEKTGDRA